MRGLQVDLVAPLFGADIFMRYVVYENEDGEMKWAYVEQLHGDVPNALKIDRVGDLNFQTVNDQEVEQITGMFVPAAYDRLRELIHESTLHFTLSGVGSGSHISEKSEVT